MVQWSAKCKAAEMHSRGGAVQAGARCGQSSITGAVQYRYCLEKYSSESLGLGLIVASPSFQLAGHTAQ